MTREIHFTKMHGLGNDYIYVNTLLYPIPSPEKYAKLWSEFHTGIGSDGLVLIGASECADFSMRIFNADGSEAMMCGNASRCIGKYLFDYGLTTKTELTLETLSGVKKLTLHIDHDKVESVTVDMGEPVEIGEINFDDEIKQSSHFISMGNPHLVTFVDDINTVALEEIGPKLEHHAYFPDRTNVEFAQVIDPETVRMRVWERGSGITRACGTGACATAVASMVTKQCVRKVTIIMDGGQLIIEWDEKSNHILMTGTATKVFDGVITIKD